MTYFIIRVEFPDDDKYAYVTDAKGLVKFSDYEKANEVAKTYAGRAIVQAIEERDWWKYESRHTEL